MNDKSLFQKLGFSQNKTAVYLAALELGSATAVQIAQKAEIRRTTAYKLLDELCSNELIEADISGRVKKFIAQPPQKLVRIFEHKRNSAMELLPFLLDSYTQKKFQPKIQFLQGKNGIKKIFEDALTCQKKIIYTFSPVKSLLSYLGAAYARHFMAKRKKIGIARKSLRPITHKSAELKDWEFYAQDKSTMREVRFLPQNIKFETLIQIYDNKISIISFEKENYAFIIESEELANFMKNIFKLIWSISKQK